MYDPVKHGKVTFLKQLRYRLHNAGYYLTTTYSIAGKRSSLKYVYSPLYVITHRAKHSVP